MLTIRRLSAFLSLVLFFGCASASEQVFNDGTWIEYSAAGDPVRFTDTSGHVFTSGLSASTEQVFDDGTRIEYSAAGDPVRFTDTSGKDILSALSR